MVVSLLAVLFLISAFGGCVLEHKEVKTESYAFTESARQLRNPGRGFYHIHGFRIEDEETDFEEEVSKRFCDDQETTLTMIQINLQYYRDTPISEKGLKNIEGLFEALKQVDKQLIVRFLYDWNGENEKYEPESIDIILEHMNQVGPILCKYKDRIFTLQGLFTGNWGEMNGTKYVSEKDIQTLADKLAQVTDYSIFLSVRMPMQWRIATRIEEEPTPLASRLGLFNDGMLGNASDYGTYGNRNKREHGYFTYWNREEELEFQNELGKEVPIGGEVIVDNVYNDFENALNDLSQMHVTYINRDYDKAVLDKWAQTIISEEGCFKGMDGLSYMERHLGYRLLIRDAQVEYHMKEDELLVEVDLQNIGFAPIYKDVNVQVILGDEQAAEYNVYEMKQDLSKLTGGNQAPIQKTIQAKIPMSEATATEYTVFFRIIDTATGRQILLANEQEPGVYGYGIGRVKICQEQ